MNGLLLVREGNRKVAQKLFFLASNDLAPASGEQQAGKPGPRVLRFGDGEPSCPAPQAAPSCAKAHRATSRWDFASRAYFSVEVSAIGAELPALAQTPRQAPHAAGGCRRWTPGTRRGAAAGAARGRPGPAAAPWRLRGRPAEGKAAGHLAGH